MQKNIVVEWLFSVCNRDSRHDVQAKVLQRYIEAPSCELQGKWSRRKPGDFGVDTKRIRVCI